MMVDGRGLAHRSQLAPIHAAVLTILLFQPLVRPFEVSVAQETSMRAQWRGMLSDQGTTARQKTLVSTRPYGHLWFMKRGLPHCSE